MGEATRRRVRCVGEIGDHQGDPELRAAMTRCLERLLPSIIELAASEGWGPVLNSLVTLHTNLAIDAVGAACVENSLRQQLRDLPSVLAQKRFLAGAGAAAGAA